MFTATKLRRGMVPKDKEGKWWTLSHGGKAMCHHLACFAHFPLFHPTATFIVLLISWGINLVAERPLRSCLHSLHDTSSGLWMVCPLSRWWLFIFLRQWELKVWQFLVWGVFLSLSYTDFLVGDIISSWWCTEPAFIPPLSIVLPTLPHRRLLSSLTLSGVKRGLQLFDWGSFSFFLLIYAPN